MQWRIDIFGLLDHFLENWLVIFVYLQEPSKVWL